MSSAQRSGPQKAASAQTPANAIALLPLPLQPLNDGRRRLRARWPEGIEDSFIGFGQPALKMEPWGGFGGRGAEVCLAM